VLEVQFDVRGAASVSELAAELSGVEGIVSVRTGFGEPTA
jgi:hypothetical protein